MAKTSRKDGILTFNTDRPYKIAIDGNQEDRNEIICHDVNAKCENAALDMEQLITTALQSIPQNKSKATKAQLLADEKKDKDFFGTDSPSEKQIEDNAKGLEMMVQMTDAVKMSDMVELFFQFIGAGVICCAGDIKITEPIWDSIHRNDKKKIMFRYCSFFVNPLEQLVNMAQSMDSQPS